MYINAPRREENSLVNLSILCKGTVFEIRNPEKLCAKLAATYDLRVTFWGFFAFICIDYFFVYAKM